jgi:hypothetical protein
MGALSKGLAVAQVLLIFSPVFRRKFSRALIIHAPLFRLSLMKEEDAGYARPRRA